MKTLTTNPDLAQILHDAAVANPVGAFALMVFGLMAFCWFAKEWI